jgi:tripeptidyl-peptidase-2
MRASVVVAALLGSVLGASTLPHAGASAEGPPWEALLSRAETGVAAWHKAHPEHDGRGVVIAILDTGIDPATPGVATTPDGRPRILAVRDFSGQGRLSLLPARRLSGTEAGLESRDGAVRGLPPGLPAEGEVYLGFFEEGRIGERLARDVDRDGHRGGRYAVALWFDRASARARAAVDLDGDGELSDETPRSSWEFEPTPLHFRSADPRRDRPPLHFGLFLDYPSRRVELVFDDGGHGTHCAGIAAGHGILGQKGLDGVAPGADLLALKIGDNRLAGGATTDGAMLEALRFAADWGREAGRPVIVNLSYGIGARDDGRTAIDVAVDHILAENPHLIATISAGNEGPGLSSVGTPAGAQLAVSVGALLPAAQAEGLLGAGRRGKAATTIFGFSSRGGELAKPDILAPGIALSSMPPFARRNVMAGTSMAAPHMAGLLALLVGRAEAEGLLWTSSDTRRAVVASARRMKGVGPTDAGAGIADVAAAWKALVGAAKRGAKDTPSPLAGYRVETAVPHRPGQKGSASFWRLGGDPRRGVRRVRFDVTPVFFGTAGDDARANWFEVHTLTNDAGWVRPAKKTLPFRGDANVSIDIDIDLDAVADAPGVHTATVRATTRAGLAFQLQVVVVVPHGPPPLSARGKLRPGEISRVFIDVPPGAGELALSLDAALEGADALTLQRFDPRGLSGHGSWARATADAPLALLRAPVDGDGGEGSGVGVQEVVISAPPQNDRDVSWELHAAPARAVAPARLPFRVGSDRIGTTDVTLASRDAMDFKGAVELDHDAFERTRTLTLEAGLGEFTIDVGEGVASLELELDLADESYGRVTDVAVTVLDPAGAEIASEAMGGAPLHVSVGARPGTYRVRIAAARVDATDPKPLQATARDRHLLADPVALHAPRGQLVLHPHVPRSLALTSEAPVPVAPDAYTRSGLLRLVDTGGDVWLERRVTLGGE